MTDYIRIAAGTDNALKLRAISNAFYKAGVYLELEGYAVPSDVPKQPFTRQEVREGAKARARRAIEKDRSALYGIGIETGIVLEGQRASFPGLTAEGPFFEVACCMILNRENAIIGESWSAAVETPKKIIDLIKNENLKSFTAVQKLTGKPDEDTIRYYTGGKTNREEVLSEAVFLALAPKFINPEAYN